MSGADADGVVVTGTGRASAPPDVVRLALAASSTASGVQEALDAAVAASGAMRDALLAGGVAAADVRTTSTELWSSAEDERAPVRQTAHLGLQATVRDVPAAGRLLTAALGAAGDAARLQGVAPAHSDDAGLAREARAAAFADARARAEQYAELAGRSLGEVREVVEGSGMQIWSARAASLARGRSDIAVEPGALDVDAAVTVRWAWAG